MRCVYCYFAEKNLSKYVEMSSATAINAINFFAHSISENPRIKANLSFNADGEPLLSKFLLLDILDYSTKLESKLNIQIEKKISTNGTLVDGDLANILAKRNVHVEISCDGPEFIQDRQRPLKNANGSYSLIKQSVSILKKAGVKFTFRAVITPISVNFLPEIIEALIKFDPSGPIKLRPQRMPNRGVPNSTFAKEFIDGYYNLIKFTLLTGKINNIPDWAIRFINKPDEPYIGYCTVGRGMLWIAPDGTVFPCGLLMEQTFNMGNINYWESSEGMTNLEVIQYLKTINPSQSTQCSQCESFCVCQGGCAALRYYKCGSAQEKRHPYCMLFKKLSIYLTNKGTNLNVKVL